MKNIFKHVIVLLLLFLNCYFIFTNLTISLDSVKIVMNVKSDSNNYFEVFYTNEPDEGFKQNKSIFIRKKNINDKYIFNTNNNAIENFRIDFGEKPGKIFIRDLYLVKGFYKVKIDLNEFRDNIIFGSIDSVNYSNNILSMYSNKDDPLFYLKNPKIYLDEINNKSNKNILNIIFSIVMLIMYAIYFFFYKYINKHIIKYYKQINLNLFYILLTFIIIHYCPIFSGVKLSSINELTIISIAFLVIFFSFKININNSFFKYFKNFRMSLYFILICFYTSFALIGSKLFFISQWNVGITFSSVVFFFIFLLWIIPINILVLWFFEYLNSKFIDSETNRTMKDIHILWIIIFFLVSLIWIFFMIVYRPANMSPDSIYQWKEAKGIIKIGNDHSALYSLIMMYLSRIWDTPTIVVVFQILFMVLVIDSFVIFLYKNGVSKKILLYFILIFALYPNNWINIVTIWKDIPFTISFLWLTLIIIKLNKTNINNYGNFSEISQTIVSLVLIVLLRNNGIITYIFCIILFIILSFKNKKFLYPIVASFLILISVKFCLYPALNINDGSKGNKYLAGIHGIAAVIYNDGNLSNETKEFMVSIMPIEIWKSNFYSFHTDTYRSNESISSSFYYGLEELTLDKFLRMYIDTFLRNPSIIIQDRLDGINILWDVVIPDKGYALRFALDVQANDIGLARKPNYLRSRINSTLISSLKYTFVESFFWRTGFYVILILLITFYWLYYNNKLNLIILIPCLGNIVSLLLAMSWQDYRYVYFVFIVFFFIFMYLPLSTSKYTSQKIK